MSNLPVHNPSSVLVSLPKQDQNRSILRIITRAVIISGTKPTEDEVAVIVSETLNLISDRYCKLTLEEISQAIRNGVLGDYDESYLSVRNINSWLRDYIIEKTKKEDQEQRKREKESEEKVPMVVKANFLLQNMDKMPSLKALLAKTESKRSKKY
jgi:hypothetical protein